MAGTEYVVAVEDCYAPRETPKALLVALPDGDEEWVPKSQIAHESEVYQEGDRGELVVTTWFAERNDSIAEAGVEREAR